MSRSEFLKLTSHTPELFHRLRKSRVPKGGWTFENFRGASAKKLIQDVMSVRKLALRGKPNRLHAKVVAMLEEEFDEVLNAFVLRLAKKQGKGIGGKIKRVLLSLVVADGAEKIFESALREVFSKDESLGRVTEVFHPVYKDVIEEIEEGVTMLIQPDAFEDDYAEEIELEEDDEYEEEPDIDVDEEIDIQPVRRISREEMPEIIDRKAHEMCAKVTRIDETTRKRMKKFFEKNIEEGTTVREMIQLLQQEFEKISRGRASTIVRNELAMAANEASILSFQNSASITHCSVIGCQSVDDSDHEYMGHHTCNIQNVPVGDMHLVEFHINHTGTWVPTGFRKDDGSIPKLRIYNTPGSMDRPK